MSQMVQVVSMLEVPNRLRSVSFQSNEVKGALNSLFLFCNQSKIPQHAGLQVRETSVYSLRYMMARLRGDTCTSLKGCTCCWK